MLLLTVLGSGSSLLGMKSLVNILVIVAGILVTVTFVLCGLFLVLHNVVGDSCVSMDEWVQHPVAHTALDDILPCIDNATAQETLSESKNVTVQLITVVNLFINVANLKFPILHYYQSGPIFPPLCSPFNYDNTDRKCASGEVDFSNASQVWRKYICQVSLTGNCTTTGRLTPADYDQLINTANVSYGLYFYGPFLVHLQDCTFVREAFTEIRKEYCPGLSRYSKWIYTGLMIDSICVALSLIFWPFHARERRHRACTKVKLMQSPSAEKSLT